MKFEMTIFQLSTAVFTDCPTDFTVDTKPLGVPVDKNLIGADITTPSGKKLRPNLKDNGDDTVTCSYVPNEQGTYSLYGFNSTA